MELKDYLHFYFGCTMKNTFGDLWDLTPDYYLKWITENHRAKPVLRPLSDMTEEEGFELSEALGIFTPANFMEAINKGSKYVIDYRNSFEITRYLLSRHFDLFGLIESGLAIDKTKQ